MGICVSVEGSAVTNGTGNGDNYRSSFAARGRSVSTMNQHTVNPDIKVHTVVSSELDCNHAASMKIPLGDCSDEQLMAEVARRKLDLHDKITDAVVKETYELGRTLGVGASGEVVLATHKVTKAKFACKVVRKDSTMNDAQSMSTEIEIMKRIRHPNVVSMYELYEAPKCLWIILELVEGGDLLQFIAQQPKLTERMIAKFMEQIFKGVHYLHSLGVVHRDLKLDNILLSDTPPNNAIKIADFGLSALVRLGVKGYDPDESNKRKKFKELTDMWGTKEYFAPEMIRQAYGPQADVWAVGCLLYEMLCGRQAFPVRRDDHEDSFFGRIKRAEYDLHGQCWNAVSSEAKGLITSLLQVDPEKRLSASEALNHSWIVKYRSGKHITEPAEHSVTHSGKDVDANLADAHAFLKKRWSEKLKKKPKKH